MAASEQLTLYTNKLKQRYQESPMPAFFSWWYQQLTSFLPERWQKVMAVGDSVLFVHQQGDDLVGYQGQVSEDSECARTSVLPEDDLAAERLFQQLEGDAAGWSRVLLMDEVQVLRRTLDMPAAAKDSLGKVLAFELDRQTPFSADQVYFDHRILPHDRDAKTLPVELVLTPRKRLDQALQVLGDANNGLKGVDVLADGKPLGVNLLPTTQRRHQKHMWLWINLALLALGLVFLFGAMNRVVANREAAVVALEEQVQTQRREAKRTQKLRRDLNDAVDAANFLAVKKAEQPSMVMILHEITELLPDDTYLNRLRAARNQLEINGESSQAAKLVGRFSDAKQVREAALSGSISPNSRTGKDRFTIKGAYGPLPKVEKDDEQGGEQ